MCEVLARAETLCIEHRCRFVGPPQLFLSALAVCARNNRNLWKWRRGWTGIWTKPHFTRSQLSNPMRSGSDAPTLSLGGETVVQFAADIADQSLITPEHLLLACLELSRGYVAFFRISAAWLGGRPFVFELFLPPDEEAGAHLRNIRFRS
jgi:hypothetical protein